MHAYFLTLAFLTLMSLMTSSELGRFTQEKVHQHFHILYQHQMQEAQQLQIIGKYEEPRTGSRTPPDPKSDSIANPQDAKEKEEPSNSKSPPKRSTSLRFNLNRPPNNARLNIALLASNEPSASPLSLYQIAARLLRTLYGADPLFQSLPQAEYHLIHALQAKKATICTFQRPDMLASLVLEDPALQALLVHVLQGNATVPSLLDYITLDPDVSGNRAKINFLFAPEPLLAAILDNPVLYEELHALRTRHWEEILLQESCRKEDPIGPWKNRKILKEELIQDVQNLLQKHQLPKDVYHRFFDWSLGTLGDVLWVQHPETGLITRTLYQKTSKKKGA